MSLWKSLIDAGSAKDNPAITAEKVRVQNTFALASIILGTPLVFVFYCLGHMEVSAVFMGTMAILSLSLFLNKRGHLNASKFLIIGIYSSVLPVYSFLIGFNSGFFLYYAIAPALMLSIFELNVKRKVFIGLVVAGCSLAITMTLGYYNPEPYTTMDPNWITIIFWLNFIFNIIIILALTLQIVLYHYNSVLHGREINEELIQNQHIIERSLQEKEVLLAEIHHRVKNNLAVMSGLMRLQSEQSNNPETKNILEKNSERIHSMSLIHNSLYNQDNLNDIDFCQYIFELVKEIEKGYLTSDKEIKITTDLETISLPVNKAIPGGLIINEILVNAIKHAFKDKEGGQVDISLKKEGKTIQLRIADNGIGFDPTVQDETLGITLIQSLTEQLDGKIEIESKNGDGTVLSLSFQI